LNQKRNGYAGKVRLLNYVGGRGSIKICTINGVKNFSRLEKKDWWGTKNAKQEVVRSKTSDGRMSNSNS